MLSVADPPTSAPHHIPTMCTYSKTDALIDDKNHQNYLGRTEIDLRTFQLNT